MNVRNLILATLSCCASAGVAAAQETPPPFRIGNPGLPAGCHDAATQTDPAWRDYLQLLEVRLGRPVSGCGVPASEAGEGLEDGTLDFALLHVADPAEGAEVKARPILSIRQKGTAPRTELVVLAPAKAEGVAYTPALGQSATLIGWSRADLVRDAAIAGHTFTDSEAARARADAIISALPDWKPGTPSQPVVAALTQLGMETAPRLVILPIGPYNETCQTYPDACKQVSVVWRGFPPISEAYAVSANVAQDVRYRLIGIHVQLHDEHPEMLAAVAGTDAAGLEPTEPQAFVFKDTR